MHPKKKRKVDKKLLENIRARGCVVCGWKPCDPHHIKSRGAGGDDTESNLLALCRKHHTEIHQIGKNKFLAKYKLI